MSQTKAQLLDGSVVSVAFSAGSAAEPSLYFAGDTNTGLYSPGADQLAISTGGTGRLFVDANGRIIVGAATAAIGNPVEIVSNSSGLSIGVRGRSSDNIGIIGFYPNNSATEYARIQSNGDSSISIGTGSSGSERLRITSAGLVGIGTSAPQDVIHAKGNSTYAGIIIDNSSATGGSAFCAYRNGVQKAVFSTDSWLTGTVNDNAAIYSADGIKFYTNNVATAKAVFTSGGLLGIGTTSPGTSLHCSSGSVDIATFQRSSAGADAALMIVDSNSTGAYINTAGGANVVFATRSAGTNSERARIDSSGRLLVGTSSTSATCNALLQTGSGTGGTLILAYGNTSPANGQDLGFISFNDSSHIYNSAIIRAARDGGTWTSGTSMPTRLTFSTTADGASSPTSRFVIKESGDVLIPAASSTKGLWIGTGDADGNGGSANFRIGQNSNGVGSSTLYIGNAAIQVSSDARLKENIQDTTLSAVEELQRVRIVDFTWNDPSDTSYNNRNARGTWTGVIAQELIEVFPFAVNAPRKEDDLSIDHDSDSTWTVEQQQLVPVLIKAIQEQQAVIADLQSRLTALEAA